MPQKNNKAPAKKQTKPLVPKLRFPEFSGKWKKIYLKDVGENIIGLTYKPSEVTSQDGILVLRSSNIKKQRLDLEDQVRVNTNIPEKKVIRDDDILICTRNGSQRLIGKNVYLRGLDEKVTFGAFMSVYRSEFNHFFNHLFKTDLYKKQVQKNLGARINQITTGYLNKFSFFIPELSEQQKIADFLSSVDEWIENLEKQKEGLEQYKKGLMQKIFPSKGGQEPEIRFRDDDGNEFAEWEEKKLGDVTKYFSEKNKKDVDAEVYSVTNTKGFVIQTDHFDKVVASNNLEAYKIVKKGDFAYNPARINVGSIAHFKSEIGIISSLYVCFRTKEEVMDEFLGYVLNLARTRHDISAYGEGGVRIYLWYNLFSLIKVRLPKLLEQQKIAEFLLSVDELIESKQKQIIKAKKWKQGLLQRMFV